MELEQVQDEMQHNQDNVDGKCAHAACVCVCVCVRTCVRACVHACVCINTHTLRLSQLNTKEHVDVRDQVWQHIN